MPPSPRPLPACVSRNLSLRHHAVAAILVIPQLAVAGDFASFQAQDSPAVAKALPLTAKQYRQIEPSLYHLVQQHAEALADLPTEQRQDRLVKLAAFIEAKRKAVATAQVIGPGQSLIGFHAGKFQDTASKDKCITSAQSLDKIIFYLT